MHRLVHLISGGIALLFTGGCTAVAFVAANTPALFGSYERSAGIAYGADPRQRLDVYAPHDAHDRPVIIFWHGGSWTGGSRAFYRFVGATLAERGFVAVLPDYRLYPQVRFPAFVEDGAQSVAWVQQHAREFGGDPRRVVLMGHSAGAHEAAMLAYDTAYLRRHGARPEWIAALIGLSGPYALDPNSEVLRSIFSAPYREKEWQPVQLVTPQAPATLLVHGMDDTVVWISHSEKLRDALQANHVRVETHFYPGRGHTDTVAALSVPGRRRLSLLEQIEAFINSLPAPQ